MEMREEEPFYYGRICECNILCLAMILQITTPPGGSVSGATAKAIRQPVITFDGTGAMAPADQAPKL